MAGARTRAMVVGIPNVGKSTLSTALRAAPRARAADKPGVTRGKQWVSAGEYDLLDMPGVLWKKFESDEVAANLAFIGAIRDEILDIETLAMNLLAQLRRMSPSAWQSVTAWKKMIWRWMRTTCCALWAESAGC